MTTFEGKNVENQLATERKFDNLTPGDIEEGGGRHCGICTQNVTVLMLKKGLGIEKGTGGTSNTAGPARASGLSCQPAQIGDLTRVPS